MGAVNWPRRILTVVVAVPAALQLLRYDAGMWLLATTLCALSVFEFTSNIAPRVALSESTAQVPSFGLVVIALGICAAAGTGSKAIHGLTAMLLGVLAIVYVVSGFSHAILLRYASPFGLGLQVLGLACAWVCDSAALVAGSLFGHTKLAPAISPGKTVAGAVAGVLASALTALALFGLSQAGGSLSPATTGTPTPTPTHSLLPSVPVIEQLALGLVLGVLCVMGDLIESYLKRVADVKDSGAFFPGHGGCLDRMDSFLFVAQALFYYSVYRF
ncbi:hypothetical protein P43SY_002261 [Pythium insidiosum]|uniref:Phosphatidate cytidylyltransferase n=1 Tax=Pythium insidiosum TaxID=114742 RepID=A0AAD5LEM0_PYTIN|nr:hypothetical protein P43SY_002261 [Pythium insidiosum]